MRNISYNNLDLPLICDNNNACKFAAFINVGMKKKGLKFSVVWLNRNVELWADWPEIKMNLIWNENDNSGV